MTAPGICGLRTCRSLARIALGGALAAIGVLAAWLGGLQLTGNIHEVEPGALYRSAQLGRAALSDVIQDYHIRTVINLRGMNPEAPWYSGELAVSWSLGVVHYDFPMSANEMVEPAMMTRLEALLRSAPKPVLIHCQSGADRSGLAAALYEYAIAARLEEESEGAALATLRAFPLPLEPHRRDGSELRGLRPPEPAARERGRQQLGAH
jgi:protein tyrosine/serine phosphatase